MTQDFKVTIAVIKSSAGRRVVRRRNVKKRQETVPRENAPRLSAVVIWHACTESLICNSTNVTVQPSDSHDVKSASQLQSIVLNSLARLRLATCF